MLTPRSEPASTLVKPVRVQNILISDEQIVYNERRHWAVLLPAFFETLALLIFITLVAGGLPSTAIGGALFLLALVIAALMVLTKKWKRVWAYIGATIIIAGTFIPQLFVFTVFAILITALRFVNRFAMWAFYERLFITNRRLIFASGLLGTDIAMMPLTRITDISYRRPMIAEFLGYGQLRVETAGQDQALGFIQFINYPDEFYELLVNRSTTAVGSGPSSEPHEIPSNPDTAVFDEPFSAPITEDFTFDPFGPDGA